MPENKRTWVDDLFEEVIQESRAREKFAPSIGDTIYIPTFEYMGGEGEVTSIAGGKAEILRINQVREPESDYYTVVVRVKNLDFVGFSWNKLRDIQNDLKKEFGDTPARMQH